MNWFKRHLNWASGLGILLGFILATGGSVKTFFESIIFLSFTGFVASLLSDIYSGSLGSLELIFAVIGLVLCLPILVWVLKQKHRTLWWILIIFVPLGFIIFPCLKNKSEVIDIANGKVITRSREESD